ncbi:MAG: TlpA family protein disulfide reductase [Rubripirellula sp.]|nr:TlpA family protein disulfide reductase [Rubripirellula sp.]
MVKLPQINIHASLILGVFASTFALFPACDRTQEQAKSSAGSEETVYGSNRSVANLQGNATLQQLAEQKSGLGDAGQNDASALDASDAEILSKPSADAVDSSQGDRSTSEDKPPNSTVREIKPVSGAANLSENWSPQKLIDFLAITDRDMQDIWGRMQQIQGGREELMRVAKLKLKASEQLRKHQEATPSQQALGARGELQALSHLASFNDVNASKKLKDIALANLSSTDTSIVSDSRLVLIGFALEGLRQGKEQSKSELMNYLLNISKEIAANDVPTLMVLGQARDTLAAYGERELANQVRNKILELYQDSSNPDLRTAANDLANHVYYDEIETLLDAARNGSLIDLNQWEVAVNTLIQQAGDMSCMQYLASAALQLEGLNQNKAVALTFRLLQSSFKDPKAETTQEIEIALKAYTSRQNIIGETFSFNLPVVKQEPLKKSEYEGKVIIVPFWTVMLPESLQLMKMLESIRDKQGDQVAILGINLDSDEELLHEFLQQNQLPFQNLHAKPSVSNDGVNDMAIKFGITSMPFLAIIDQNQKVAAINFTGQGVEEIVVRLIQQKNTPKNSERELIQ